MDEIISECEDPVLKQRAKAIFNPRSSSTDQQKQETCKQLLDFNKRQKLDVLEQIKQAKLESWDEFFSSYFIHSW